MNLHLSPKVINELLPTNILFQTGFWGKVKKRVGYEPIAFDINNPKYDADVLILNQTTADNKVIAYIPQGPEFQPSTENYGIYLEEFSHKLIPHLAPNTSFIRFDLPWLSPYAQESIDNHAFIPAHSVQEMRMNYGTNSYNLIKSVNDMTVASNIAVDITPDEQSILTKMKPKTRYNIGLSKRKGVKTFIASKEHLPIFYDLYVQTAQRNKFLTCDYTHFKALFQVLEQSNEDADIVFIISCHENDVLAGVIMTITEKTALFLFGASSNIKRNLMGSYAVHWEAILQAKARNCSEYDMGGVSPTPNPEHPFYGLYCFKTGFGGKITHRVGTWDFPLNHDDYMAYRNAETILSGLGG